MGAVARTLKPARFLPWRGIAIVGLLLALAAAAIALYAGSHPHLPPRFGPARNGALLTSVANNDIVAFDPATGTTRSVLAGAGIAVTFSSSGQLFFYDKSTTGAPEIWVANAGGSGGHHVWSGPASTTTIDWSQDGERLVMAEQLAAGGTAVHLVDPQTGADTILAFSQKFVSVAQPLGSHSLLLSEQPQGQPATYYLAGDDGTGLRALPAVSPVGSPSHSPDGSRIAYVSWEEGRAKQGVLHVLDLATGVDKPVTDGSSIWMNPVFSPDGTHVAAQRFVPGTQTFDVAITAIDVAAPVVVLGGQHVAENGSGLALLFSPDGTELIARYADDSTAWLFSATGGAGQQLPGITTEFFSWQRIGE